jgi:hypothetical protein
LYLVKTTDGRNFQKVSKIELDGFPNEATIRFDESGKMFVLIRRELDDKMGVLAKSSFPYTHWEFDKLTYRLGGPNFIFYGDKIIVGTRIMESEVYTGILVGDTSGNLRKILALPSGGDTSYRDLCWRKINYWCRIILARGKICYLYGCGSFSCIEKLKIAPPVHNRKRYGIKLLIVPY